MKRSGVLLVAAAIVSVSITLVSVAAGAQSDETVVTGAGESTFPDGTKFNGVPISGLEVGTGLSISSDGTATGSFFAVLLGTSPLGQPQEIEVDGTVNSGSVRPDDSATFSGTATVDMGDGRVPLKVPFTVTATTESLVLKLWRSILPPAALTAGSITIE